MTKEELVTKVYQLVNGIRDVPEISRRIFGEDAKIGTDDFFAVRVAVDNLLDKAYVYFRDSDGVLLDLQR